MGGLLTMIDGHFVAVNRVNLLRLRDCVAPPSANGSVDLVDESVCAVHVAAERRIDRPRLKISAESPFATMVDGRFVDFARGVASLTYQPLMCGAAVAVTDPDGKCWETAPP